ncbi:pdxA protein product [Niveomyces insectorum RCEF 264]|uniref:PdxA protein product n=1 Tax=Niveomyces insectorum RCEF 264 TaxID=1081102 RepID=A0A167T8F6_9HYPO|nr:pdxA protein product [Niveomyces insectorum RCEF 264]
MGSLADETITGLAPPRRVRIAVVLGDAAGIGPELIAKLISNPANTQRADIVLLADRCELDAAIVDAAGAHVLLADDGKLAGPTGAQLLEDGTATQFGPIPRQEVSRAAGARCLHQLKRALALVQAGDVDAILFGPLNKTSLKLAGMTEEDELRWFAKQLEFHGRTSEINIAGSLWTARVTSHIGLEAVAARITTQWESGIAAPRLAVCALNPHNGENGAFGRQEIDHIRPAVKLAQEKGIDVQGPFPCDTIFLKREHFDGIVTMYHDQGQIAMKLLSFEGGVTMQGGLPIPVATPAHGTAFDIVGKNLASIASTQNAFDTAVTMAERRLLKAAGFLGIANARANSPVKPTPVHVHTCC